MPRTKGPGRAFAMHVELPQLASDAVLFQLAGVVRYVVQQRQLRRRQQLGEHLAHQVRQDLPVGQRAVDGGAHGPQVFLAEFRVDRCTGQLAVGQRQPIARRCHDHPAQEFGTDLVPQATRAAMDHHHHIAQLQAVGLGDGAVEHLSYLLHLQVVVATAQSAHLVALAPFGLLGHQTGLGMQHLPMLLDARQVVLRPPAATNRPFCTARQHRIHLRGTEPDGTGAAQTGRNLRVQRVRQRLLHRQDLLAPQSCKQATHAARDIKAHAPGGHHAARIGVERRYAAYREAVTPVRVRHDVRRAHNARQCRHVDGLLQRLVVHPPQQAVACVDHHRHPHGAGSRQFPVTGAAFREVVSVHHTSTTV